VRKCLWSLGFVLIWSQIATAQGPAPVVGHKAPEIKGEDIDGKKLRLSEYRGKVVLLDFWGNW